MRTSAASEHRLDRLVMRDHDPNHPYVRKLIGCGHGRTWGDECVECEIAGLLRQYKDAIKTVQRVRNRLRKLGAPLPGEVAS